MRDAIGLSAEQTVCSWESKTHPKLPSIDNALNLARLYGVRLDQLYKTRPVKTGSPEKVDQEIRDRITISMRMGEFEEFFDDMRMERKASAGHSSQRKHSVRTEPGNRRRFRCRMS